MEHLKFWYPKYACYSFYRFRRDALFEWTLSKPGEELELWLPVLATEIKYFYYSMNSGKGRAISRNRNARCRSCHIISIIYILKVTKFQNCLNLKACQNFKSFIITFNLLSIKLFKFYLF